MAARQGLRVVRTKGDLAAGPTRVVSAKCHPRGDIPIQDEDPPWVYSLVPDVPADTARTEVYNLEPGEDTVVEDPLARLIAEIPKDNGADSGSFPELDEAVVARIGRPSDLDPKEEDFYRENLAADRPNGRHYEDPAESSAPRSYVSSRLKNRSAVLGLAGAVGLTLYGLVSALSTRSPVPVTEAQAATAPLEAKVKARDFTKIRGKRGTLFRYAIRGDETHSDIVNGFDGAYGTTCRMNVSLSDLIYANGGHADALNKGGRVYFRVPKDSPCNIYKPNVPSTSVRRSHSRQLR